MSHTLCLILVLAPVFGFLLILACCLAGKKEPELNIFGGGIEGEPTGESRGKLRIERPEPLPTISEERIQNTTL